MTTPEAIMELGHRWADAERRGDAGALDELAIGDFTLVGPLGYILTKQQWLDRYRDGDLVTTELGWEDVAVRDYGDAAVAVGVQVQRAAYRGRPSDGRFRVTHIAVRDGGEWKLAGVHLSPLGAPPPMPPGK
jgi:ketosteroid isomerase-like protein